MSYYKNKISLHNGNILLYHNSSKQNPIWQMRLKFPKHLRSALGKNYITKTTGCADLGSATQYAMEYYQKAYTDLNEGVKVDINRGFTHQLNEYITFNQLNVGLNVSKHTVESFKYYARYWREFFGNKDVRNITTRDIDEYRAWRLSYWTTGPGVHLRMPANGVAVPSDNTMRQDRQRLKQFLIHLSNTNILRKVPVFNVARKEKATRRKVGRRDHFTSAEWNRVSNRLNAYAFGKDSAKYGPRNAFERKLLYYYCMVSANLGTRPGETRNLKWSYVNVSPSPQDPSVDIITVNVPPSSKTGSYTAIGMFNAIKYFNGLRALYEERFGNPPPQDAFVFTNYSGEQYKYPENTFRKLLRAWGEYEDADGRVRNLYSLRGLYITLLLNKGVPVHTVAKSCGTSVKQIERHYDRSAVSIDPALLRPGSQRRD